MATAISRGNVSGLCVVDLTLAPASVAADTVVEQTFTVPGVRFTDVAISATFSGAQPAGIGIAGVRVVSDEQVAVAFSNNTVAGVVPTAQRYRFTIGRLDTSLNAFQG